jgi:predicted O-methyltransferase YrrM
MNSSYKNKDIEYSAILESVAFSIRPKTIIEIGILDGYSLHYFINATNSINTKIVAYDIFDTFNGNHAKEDELKNKFKNHSNVEINYGDFYELHKTIMNNSIEIIHIDIANNGEIYEYAIQNYLPKLSSNGIIILEGGSEQRDNVAWMNKYNKLKIQPILEKYHKKYNIKTFGSLPSITLIAHNPVDPNPPDPLAVSAESPKSSTISTFIG